MKKNRKKNPKKNYSVLIYSTILCIIAAIALFFMFSGANINLNEIITNMFQTQQEAKKEIPQTTNTIQTPQKEAKTAKQPTIKLPKYEDYKYEISYKLHINGTVKNLVFTLPVPSNEQARQYIVNSKFLITPTQIYNDGTTQYAEFNFPQIGNQTLNIGIIGDAKVRTYDLNIAKLVNKNLTPETNLNRYLEEEQYIEVNDPTVQYFASKIEGETTEEIVQNIYEFIQNHMTYKIIPNISGAKKALNDKVGKCSEYSAIMVALCRAKGIPARIVIGNIAREQMTKHNWVEVYFNEYGWVTFDPTTMPMVYNIYQNGKLVRQEKKMGADKIYVKYITSGKNLFSPFNLKYSRTPAMNGKVNIEEKIKIEKIESTEEK